MANEQNLKHTLTVSEQRKGGKKSAKVRKEKKTIKTLLADFLESGCKDTPTLKKLAEKLGMADEDSVKKLLTVTCVLNSIQNGEVKDLKAVQELLGETEEKQEEGVKIYIDV